MYSHMELHVPNIIDYRLLKVRLDFTTGLRPDGDWVQVITNSLIALWSKQQEMNRKESNTNNF